MESLIQEIVEKIQGNSGNNLIISLISIFLISMTPILELRGGLIAAKLFHVDWMIALPVCIIGNLLPIPFILLFIKKIFNKLKNTRFVKAIDRFEQKLKKKSASILKYETFGLFLFVAIPLPGTGAWTGAAAASFLEMPLKNSIISISLGVISAGIIMTLLSYGVLGFFYH